MPTRPPYPREARIVTVEKGNGDQTVTRTSCVPITLNLIR